VPAGQHKRLEGKVALVTGASRGIGARTAQVLAAEGACVACSARTVSEGDHPLEGSLERTVASIVETGGMALALQANLAEESECEELVQRVTSEYGAVDVLVNNAAIAYFGPLLELTTKRWWISWRVSVAAPFVLMNLVAPAMATRGWGRIVNISSESAIGPGRGPYDDATPMYDTAYGAQKAAIERLTQGFAEEMYPSGVGVAAIAPSKIVPTPGAVMNAIIAGDEDPRAEPIDVMASAVLELLTAPLAEMAGRVVYSQQLLKELGALEDAAGVGVDPGVPVSGYSLR
jgi:NAD(P)-dependent dehydrogenase (short-subunit alcohol dehydrogenase family)